MCESDQPIYCDLTVFSSEKRKELAAEVPDLFRAADEVAQLSDGYALQFPNEPGLFSAMANFVEHERQCCPFFRFNIEVAPHGGPITLSMTGADGVKDYMETTWDDIQEAVARNKVRTGSDDDLEQAVSRAAPVLAATIKRVRGSTPEDE